VPVDGTFSGITHGSFIDVEAVQPLRVVIDAANGMAGAMLLPVLAELPIDAVRCCFGPDGTFPNHEPNPLLPENREFIERKVVEEQADLGVAFDGDADRCFFVDDTGEFVPGDFVTALLAESILEKEPGGKVIYDLRASWALPETVERAGGVPIVNRVGHAFIKHRMRKEEAAFGGEVSGHYYFRAFSPADSGVVPFLLMLELVSKKGRKL
jgi:phosphomannomutase